MQEEKAQMTESTAVGGIESTVKETVAALKGIPTEEALTQMLKEQILKVTFLKLDGEQRVMTCTKSMDYIPEIKRPHNVRPSKPGTTPKTATIHRSTGRLPDRAALGTGSRLGRCRSGRKRPAESSRFPGRNEPGHGIEGSAGYAVRGGL
jgi:hypothetical protein